MGQKALAGHLAKSISFVPTVFISLAFLFLGGAFLIDHFRTIEMDFWRRGRWDLFVVW